MSTVHHERSAEGCYCLFGVLDGREQRFALWGDELTVGSLGGSDIHLPVPAVSRRHAVLRVQNGHVHVRDLGSKNGTWINGFRIEEGRLLPGDDVAFGPVTFRLVELDPEDGVLAMRGEDQEPHPASEHDGTSDTRTQVRRTSGHSADWLGVLDELSAVLLDSSGPGIRAAMERLAEAAGAKGAVLAEADGDGGTVVLASGGSRTPPLDHPELRREILKALKRSAESREKVVSLRVDRPEPTVMVAAANPAGGGLVLAVVGARGAGEDLRVLLRPILRMVLRNGASPTPESAAQATTEPVPDLVFPEGYVACIAPAMREMYGQVRQLLRGGIPVLITGETGVGKDLVARILHLSSNRAGGPFVAVNCAAIPTELLEAELFGIERGVATGVGPREGKFQLASGGTIFLDEISDMSLELQAKVLRAIQEHEVHPLGARRSRPVDVRIVSATNTDLRKRMAEGRFRQDLFYRVAGFELAVPPLRERREDIAPLVEHFLKRYATEIGKPVRGLTVKALRLLQKASWPGNVRELEHEVRRMVYLCHPNQAIDSTAISAHVLASTLHTVETDLADILDLTLETHTAELERRLITLALSRAQGNITHAAKLLGLSRNGLKKRMTRYGIEATGA